MAILAITPMLLRIWKDPVWSKVIATGVIAVLAFWYDGRLIIWFQDNKIWQEIKDLLLIAWSTIISPISVPLGLLATGLLIISILAITLVILIDKKVIPKKKAIFLLNQQINRAESLIESRPLTSDKLNSWKLLTESILTKVFGHNSPNASALTKKDSASSNPMYAGETYWENQRVESLQTMISTLHSLVEILKNNIM